jgi:hypothetical protein
VRWTFNTLKGKVEVEPRGTEMQMKDREIQMKEN